MSFKNKLKVHAEEWVEKGVITPSQKVAILNDVQNESSAGRFFKILAVIGALFIGLGVILIISANWYHLPKIFKLLLILFMPIVSISAGYYLSYVKSTYSKIGDAFIVLGSLLIGASIGLYGQLYNIDGSIGSLLLLWFILSLPLTVIFKFKTLATISTALFYGMIFALIQDSSLWGWREKEMITVRVFHILPFAVLLASELVRRLFKETTYNVVLSTVAIISLKLLLLVLFIGTLGHEELFLFGDSSGAELIQNIFFLGAVFSTMWYTNKNYMTQLQHTTFFWLGAYIVAKYFAWFWSYMQTGVFFLLFGILLITMVWGYIKMVKFVSAGKKSTYTEDPSDIHPEGDGQQ